jgi:putative endonuclease
MTFKKKRLGARGEEIAARYLKKRGYRIVDRNYRNRLGEIDIVAEQGGSLVFVEVRTRSDIVFGSPFESVTVQKQQQLSKVALEYINQMGCHNRAARFDVVGVQMKQGSDNGHEAAVELLQNAFDLCYGS